MLRNVMNNVVDKNRIASEQSSKSVGERTDEEELGRKEGVNERLAMN